MSKILLDTSVVIDFLRRKDKKAALLTNILDEDLVISIATHTELFSGKGIWEKKESREKLDNFFTRVAVISLSVEISEKAGYIKAHGYCPDLLDSIIAATAMDNECMLATLNVKDFKDIPGIKLFK